MLRLHALVISLAIAAAALVAAQAPPRDVRGPAPEAGAGAIRGQVIDARTMRPLRRARVVLTGPGLPERGGVSSSTDEEGRYELAELPAGRFTLSVQRGGYLQLRYGQRYPGEQPKPLDLEHGQTLDGIDFALPRAAVISGRITDELGEPIEGVVVSAQRMMYSASGRRLMPASPITRTDDEGEYRLVAIMPGTYIVNARTLDKWTVSVGGRDETMGYAPTFFPGVTNPGEAVRVTVTTGQEVPNTDFPLVPGRAATITGTALDSRGEPATNVSLSYEVMGAAGGLTGTVGQTPVGADGRFEIRGVPPGEYRLRSVGKEESSSMTVLLTGDDLVGVALTTSAGWTIRGGVVVDGDEPARLRRGDVTLTPAPLDGRTTAGMGPVLRATVNDDWTFVVSGVVEPARLRVRLPEGWAVKALMEGERDIADAPFDLASGQELDGLQLIVTDRIATLTGELVDEDGAAADGTVLLFTADASKWYDNSRFVHAARPDQQGRYRIAGVLPGDYLAVALDYVEQGDWNDAAFLESLRRQARAVSIDRPGSHTMTIRLVRP